MSQQRALRKLFDGLADLLNKVIEEGVPMMDKDGKITIAPAPAAYASVARQFLKDNNYEADPDKHRGLASLAHALPFAGQDELDARSEHDIN